jgi:hypothetical protein
VAGRTVSATLATFAWSSAGLACDWPDTGLFDAPDFLADDAACAFTPEEPPEPDPDPAELDDDEPEELGAELPAELPTPPEPGDCAFGAELPDPELGAFVTGVEGTFGSAFCTCDGTWGTCLVTPSTVSPTLLGSS